VAAPASRAEPCRSLSHRSRQHGCVVAQGTGVRRPGLPGGRGVHGSRQLGHGPRGRLALRLRVAFGGAGVEPHGDPVAGPRREARHRDRARPGTGVPRSLLAPDRARPVGAVRGGDRGVRPGGGDRLGDRAEPAVRDSPSMGHRDHGARRPDRPVPPAQGLPTARSARGGADRDHRRLLPVRGRTWPPSPAASCRLHPSSPIPTSCTSPSGSSVPP